MADLFGATSIPLAVTTPAGDPGLQNVADYCKAVLNAYASDAWAAVSPADAVVVRSVFTHDPSQRVMVDDHLPALYLWRAKGKSERQAQGIRAGEDVLMLQWVYPPTQQDIQRERDTFGPRLYRVLEALIERGRDPSWFKVGDTTEGAAPIIADADSFKLAAATSTSAQLYSGAALDGVVGAAAMAPRRSIQLTTASAVGAYNAASPVVYTYVTWYDQQATVALQPTANGGDVLTTEIEAKQLISIATPAQTSTLGSFQHGNGPRAGRGSVLLQKCGFNLLVLTDWEVAPLIIQIRDPEGRVVRSQIYQSIRMTGRIREDLVIDKNDTTRFHPHDEIENDFVRSDGSIVTQQLLPDEGE